MNISELTKRTTVNIQEKANLIWAIADKLVGTNKPHEYGDVILPMCVIKRFSDTLAATKDEVLKKDAWLIEHNIQVRDVFLRKDASEILIIGATPGKNAATSNGTIYLRRLK